MSSFTVLLIEPDFSNVAQVRDALTCGSMRSEMRWVTDGNQALRFLRREEGFGQSPRPDAILLTWNLSGDDAGRLKGAIESDPVLRRIPVITLTPEKNDRSMREKYACHTRANAPLERPHRHHAILH